MMPLRQCFNDKRGTAVREKALIAQMAVHLSYHKIPINLRKEVDVLE